MNIKQIEQTCSACPSQWNFITDDGRVGYVRYRWGYLSIRITPKININDLSQLKEEKYKFVAVSGFEIYGEQVDSSGWEGIIEWDNVFNKIKDIDVDAAVQRLIGEYNIRNNTDYTEEELYNYYNKK